jgi:prepilin-type N-terminal cleavage/methylation domain-containing protein
MGSQRQTRGFSLIELLVVVTILGILAVVGVSMVGNREAASVRSLLDEVEGALTNARQVAVATGRDVAIYNWGTWAQANPLVIAYGDNSLTSAQIQATATAQLTSTALPVFTFSQTVGVPFHFLPNDTNYSRARIVVGGSGDWAAAMAAAPSGSANTDITTLDPFQAGDAMSGLVGTVSTGTSIFNVAPALMGVVSGSTQRFTSSFVIEIVGTSPDNGPLAGSPMGLLVVLAGGAEVYKFYNPGVLEGNGQWRRI